MREPLAAKGITGVFPALLSLGGFYTSNGTQLAIYFLRLIVLSLQRFEESGGLNQQIGIYGHEAVRLAYLDKLKQ